jgi:integrase
MIGTLLQDGAEIATSVRTSSVSNTQTLKPVKTTGDLLAVLGQNPPKSLAMLKSTCGLLGIYFDLPGDQIPLEMIDDDRTGFRTFLLSRKYSENSIRTYIHQRRALLRRAQGLGWDRDQAASEEWKPLIAMAEQKKFQDIVRHFSRITKTPAEVAIEDVEHWCGERTNKGLMYTNVAAKRNAFWRLLRSTGWTTHNPPQLIKQSKYGIPLDQLDPQLKAEIEDALKWKTAEYSKDRPKWGKIRPVTARGLRLVFSQIAGFAINVYGARPTSLVDLIQRDLIEGFVEWAINERKHKGVTLQSRLGSVAAVMCHRREYANHDFTWMKLLIDAIELEDESERKQRKAEKYIDYDVLERIPGEIRAVRQTCAKKKKSSPKHIARMAMEEFMFRWLLVLPWRQRNLRECRIGGASPNLFKGRISPFSEIDKPAWVVEEEARNPNAEFWQVKFTAKETKTGLAIHLLLPRQLIGPLEEYLTEHRPILLAGKRTETLLVNQRGKPIRADLVDKVIGHWSLKFAGVRTTPHLFRDSVAYMWLKAHAKDYLTLSKLLWHKSVETTIKIYGARFNESSGVCAMETWLDQRDAIVAMR